MIIGICAILKRIDVVKQFPQNLIFQLLSFCYSSLTKQKLEESRVLKRRLKKEIDCNFVSSDSEDEEESDEENLNINHL